MYKIGLLLCGVFVLSQGHSLRKRDNGQAMASVIDELIYEYTLNTSVIELNNFKFDWHFNKLGGVFAGEGGWIKNVTTLKRRGNLELVEGEDTLTLGISLGLDDFSFGFQHFSTSLYRVSLNGKLHVKVGENEVYGKITIKMHESSCETIVDDIKVTKLSNFVVTLSEGFILTDWMYSSMAQNMANNNHQAIADGLSKYLKDAAAQALKDHNICQKFLFF